MIDYAVMTHKSLIFSSHVHITQSYLRTSTCETVTVDVGNTPSQRTAQHLQLLPADHMTCQVLLECTGIMKLL